jgi:undecaprenyl-diphosphatase
MTWVEAIVLGIVQGLTEFLPVSSSAHLRITSAIFFGEDAGASFTAVTQLGTEAAVLIYFRNDIWSIATVWVRSLYKPVLRSTVHARMGWYLIVATVPISILGLTFEDQIENGARDLYLVGTVLIVFGLVLGYADRVGKHDRELGQISTRDGILIGLAQSLALIPGVSRSGATIFGGLVLGLDRRAAAEFSFFLAMPTMVAAFVYDFMQVKDHITADRVAEISVGFVFAFISAALVVKPFLDFVTRVGFGPFAWYRIVFGIVILGVLAMGWL